MYEVVKDDMIYIDSKKGKGFSGFSERQINTPNTMRDNELSGCEHVILLADN